MLRNFVEWRRQNCKYKTGKQTSGDRNDKCSMTAHNFNVGLLVACYKGELGVKGGWEYTGEIQGRFCKKVIRTARGTSNEAAKRQIGTGNKRRNVFCRAGSC